ncbi:MAG TPA: condensation domain-containing protein, partial [Caulobacter sp.]|nr:condensation domain-containing protein [Caulobacter sp.]
MTQAYLDALVSRFGAGRIADLYPVTPLQHGLLFHADLDADTSAYVTCLTWMFRGRVEPELYRAAWTAVVERHDILRTAFDGLDLDQPLQVVMKSASLDFEELDWSDLPAAERQARFAALREAQARTPFDLAAPPLMRLRFVRVGAAESWIAWTSHHVILDGWSTSILMEEVARTYTALSARQASDLTPSAPYKDYVRYLRDKDTGAAERHWRDVVAGRPPMALPFSVSTRPAAGDRHQEIQRVFSCPLERAREAAARSRVSLNTLLMAAWTLVLAPFGQAGEVVFGVTSSGRSPDLGDVERRVGLYVTTTPMRVATGAGRVSDWLRSVADAQSRNMAHEHVALTRIQAWAGLERGESLFETTYAFENYPVAEAVGRLGDAVVENVVGSDRPHYPLNILVVADDKLWARCIHDRGRLSSAMASCLLERFDEHLAWLVDNPEGDLATLPLASKSDRVVFQSANLTRSDYPELTVHGLVEAAAAADPEAIAVSDAQGGTITYRDLDRRAGDLAARLAALGVGADVVVGVRLSRSIEVIVALLAILKAGGAYLGLDSHDPLPRARRLVEIARAALVITSSDLALGEACCPQLLIDKPCSTPETSGEVTRGGANLDSLAYLAFTSGSTGTPKAVAVTHRGVVRLLSRPNFVSITKADVFLHAAPLAFDASTLEIWGALIHGAHLALYPAEPVDPEEIVRQVRDRGVTVLWLTAGLFQQVSAGLGAASTRLSQLLVGGDVVSPTDAARILESPNPPTVINGYGPTEATTFSACHTVAAEDLGFATLPIG